MWVHIMIFGLLLAAGLGWKAGWLPMESLGGSKGFRLFAAVVLAGNLAGALLTWQNGGEKRYSEGCRLKKEEDGIYEERFMVSVDGEEAGELFIQVPEKELEKEEESQPDQVLTEAEKQQKELLEAVERYNQERNDPDYYYLPEDWDGRHLEWEKPGDTSGALLAALCFAAGLALLMAKGREKQKLLAARQEELLMDYPGLVMKFTLLVQAGMTVRRTFQKIALDYKRKDPDRPRAAYEEILMICREMDSGVSELEAYRRFGERCGQIKYKTFATLLIQNLQKGSRRLADTLEKESLEAWDERKRKARVLGETASMRLLVPMVLLMLVVMAVIMIPACLSFYSG